jgi:acyl CoA:acetate/3-ketoacid CoA transferase beta subunit
MSIIYLAGQVNNIAVPEKVLRGMGGLSDFCG